MCVCVRVLEYDYQSGCPRCTWSALSFNSIACAKTSNPPYLVILRDTISTLLACVFLFGAFVVCFLWFGAFVVCFVCFVRELAHGEGERLKYAAVC